MAVLSINKEEIMKAIKKILFLIGLSVFAWQTQATQESSFCENMGEVWVKEFARNKHSAEGALIQLQANLSKKPNEQSEQFNLGIEAFFNGDVEKSTEEFEKIMQAKVDNHLLNAFTSSFLSGLYFEKGDIEKSYHHTYKWASFVAGTSTIYDMTLFHSKICEEELKETREKLELKLLADDDEIKKFFPNAVDTSAHTKYYMDINNYPKDYIKAYYWANLAVEWHLPLADELRDLIAENMTDEEIEEALNFSY